MAASILAWFRLDVRRQWRSLLVLALLIALAGGTVMAAAAGARRGATSVDRLLAQTLPPTAVVLPNQSGFDWDAVRALPEVEAVATFVVGGFDVDELPPEDQDSAVSFPWADDEIMRTVERPVIFEGRLADPTRADEAVITPKFKRSYSKGVGDTLTFRMLLPEQVDAMRLDGVYPTSVDGPAVEVTIVGVVHSAWFSEETRDDPGVVVPSAGLFAAYAPNLIGAQSSAYINALVRLHGGEAAIPAFQESLAAVTGRSTIDVWNWADEAAHVGDVIAFEARSLLVFAFAAAVAAVFLVGQSIARYTASALSDLHVLRGLGMSSTQSRWAAATGPALAAVAGSILGVVGAVVASMWFPIGSAARVEPAPGIDVDAWVLGAGLVAMPLLVVAGALAAAALAMRSARTSGTRRRSAVVADATRLGLPVPLTVGARFALEPGRGVRAVPVRPALTGAITGVLGVIAAFTFSYGVSDAVGNPARFGQTHQLESYLGWNGFTPLPVDELLGTVAADPQVSAVADARAAVAQSGGVAVAVFAADPINESLETVVISGRMPNGPGQIAVAPRTAEAAGVEIGDTIELAGAADQRMTVVVTGLAFVPQASHNDYATGAWASRQTYDELFGVDGPESFKQRSALVSLVPDADPVEVAARLNEAVGVDGFLAPPYPPVEVAELQEIRVLPVFLAGFLALLALGAVGHALATAVRRRRHDVAVLRAVGMTRRQARGLVITQATVLALAGLMVGLPLGVALGRTTWRYVADVTPVFYLPPVAWLALILVVPAALLAVNLLAAWPGHRASSMRVGHVLRAE